MSPDNNTKCLLNHQIQSGIWYFILINVEVQIYLLKYNTFLF